jgi:hypothetical protein
MYEKLRYNLTPIRQTYREIRYSFFKKIICKKFKCKPKTGGGFGGWNQCKRCNDYIDN